MDKYRGEAVCADRSALLLVIASVKRQDLHRTHQLSDFIAREAGAGALEELGVR